MASRKGGCSSKQCLATGATGSAKTTFLNGIDNNIFNVQWEDTYCFQLIQEQTTGNSHVDSQNSHITAYDIY
jgi:hypothetical protein